MEWWFRGDRSRDSDGYKKRFAARQHPALQWAGARAGSINDSMG
jgi:hypothetical protein